MAVSAGSKDANGTDFIATSCQGLGASVWWPNKDHMYDEVDSMDISVEVPETFDRRIEWPINRYRPQQREKDKDLPLGSKKTQSTTMVST